MFIPGGFFILRVFLLFAHSIPDRSPTTMIAENHWEDGTMKKIITDERTGLHYELVGDYYLIAGEDEPEEDQPIGVWGQRHLRYLKEHHRVRYANLLTSGELNAHLADVDRQAEALFLRLVKQMADAEDITETLKTNNQMEWVRRMNSCRDRATEIVYHQVIYT